jgi:hypothetical protein
MCLKCERVMAGSFWGGALWEWCRAAAYMPCAGLHQCWCGIWRCYGTKSAFMGALMQLVKKLGMLGIRVPAGRECSFLYCLYTVYVCGYTVIHRVEVVSVRLGTSLVIRSFVCKPDDGVRFDESVATTARYVWNSPGVRCCILLCECVGGEIRIIGMWACFVGSHRFGSTGALSLLDCRLGTCTPTHTNCGGCLNLTFR